VGKENNPFEQERMHQDDLHELKKQNEELKLKLAEYKSKIDEMELQQRTLLHSLPCYDDAASLMVGKEDDSDITQKALSIIILGASGDLAKKKTYPALYSLFLNNMLPHHAQLMGFARSDLPLETFREQIGKGLPGKAEDKKREFLDRCFYFRGNYDSAESFGGLHQFLLEKEASHKGANRMFYFAIPPTVFVASAKSIREKSMSPTGWTRIVVEKPFGRDADSAAQLGKELGNLFTEDQIFRIDHYLGKEMVQNLMVLRFANEVFEPVWNRHHIASVQITFKEPFGTQGRGGYFDEFGIIRDVMQNHLIQILALVAMEPPVSMRSEDVRDEKAKLLRAVPPVTLENLVIGQYGPDKLGREPAYLDDPTVPKDSITPTYAAAILHINNSRWKGTPFILKCGKALDERKAEVRITFKKPATGLFLENDLAPNELLLGYNLMSASTSR